MDASDLGRRLPARVASAQVGAMRQEPVYRFCISTPREMH
jgi:hypothetical protein